MPKTRRLSDTTLVRRSQQGDRRAFAALLGRYDRRLRGLAHALLLDAAQMDAALSLAYLRAWRDVVRITPKDDIGAWLYRATYNACIDQLRRGEAGTVTTSTAATASAPDGDPVAAGLAALAPADRVAVVLVDREGFSPASAARILGLTPPVLLERLDVARQSLAAVLDRGSATADERPEGDAVSLPPASNGASPASDDAGAERTGSGARSAPRRGPVAGVSRRGNGDGRDGAAATDEARDASVGAPAGAVSTDDAADETDGGAPAASVVQEGNGNGRTGRRHGVAAAGTADGATSVGDGEGEASVEDNDRVDGEGEASVENRDRGEADIGDAGIGEGDDRTDGDAGIDEGDDRTDGDDGEGRRVRGQGRRARRRARYAAARQPRDAADSPSDGTTDGDAP